MDDKGGVGKFKKPLVSPKGDKIENRRKQQDTLAVISVMVKIVNFTAVPLRLYEAYVIDGLSRCFAHYALGTFSLIAVYARMHKMIGSRLFRVLAIPTFIVFLGTHGYLFVVCIYRGCFHHHHHLVCADDLQ